MEKESESINRKFLFPKLFLVITAICFIGLFLSVYYLTYRVNVIETVLKSVGNGQQVFILNNSKNENEKVGNDSVGVNELKIISPEENKAFCIGSELNISWQTSARIDFVEIIVGGSPGGGAVLSQLPSSYNEEGKKNYSGTYVWKVGDSRAGPISPGTYFLTINGNNSDYSTSLRTFVPIFIEECKG